MLALQTFYNIQSNPANPVSDRTSQLGEDDMLFIEIARAFGLSYWIEDDITKLRLREEQA